MKEIIGKGYYQFGVRDADGKTVKEGGWVGDNKHGCLYAVVEDGVIIDMSPNRGELVKRHRIKEMI